MPLPLLADRTMRSSFVQGRLAAHGVAVGDAGLPRSRGGDAHLFGRELGDADPPREEAMQVAGADGGLGRVDGAQPADAVHEVVELGVRGPGALRVHGVAGPGAGHPQALGRGLQHQAVALGIGEERGAVAVAAAPPAPLAHLDQLVAEAVLHRLGDRADHALIIDHHEVVRVQLLAATAVRALDQQALVAAGLQAPPAVAVHRGRRGDAVEEAGALEGGAALDRQRDRVALVLILAGLHRQRRQVELVEVAVLERAAAQVAGLGQAEEVEAHGVEPPRVLGQADAQGLLAARQVAGQGLAVLEERTQAVLLHIGEVVIGGQEVAHRAGVLVAQVGEDGQDERAGAAELHAFDDPYLFGEVGVGIAVAHVGPAQLAGANDVQPVAEVGCLVDLEATRLVAVAAGHPGVAFIPGHTVGRLGRADAVDDAVVEGMGADALGGGAGEAVEFDGVHDASSSVSFALAALARYWSAAAAMLARVWSTASRISSSACSAVAAARAISAALGGRS